VRDQLAANTTNHRRRADAAEPSLLAGVLVDVAGERFTPSHAVKKGRCYRYYVFTALITEAGTDRTQGWRLPAQEIEDAVIRILADALTTPAMLFDRCGIAGMPSDQTRKLLDRVTRLAAALKRSQADRANTELTAPLAFKRRGVEMRLMLPEAAMQNDRSRCDPTLIKAIARGRAWFEKLAAGRARSLRQLAERDGITRRYVRRLVDLAFLSPERSR
jgi:site-specific DNA recombinase